MKYNYTETPTRLKRFIQFSKNEIYTHVTMRACHLKAYRDTTIWSSLGSYYMFLHIAYCQPAASVNTNPHKQIKFVKYGNQCIINGWQLLTTTRSVRKLTTHLNISCDHEALACSLKLFALQHLEWRPNNDGHIQQANNQPTMFCFCISIMLFLDHNSFSPLESSLACISLW